MCTAPYKRQQYDAVVAEMLMVKEKESRMGVDTCKIITMSHIHACISPHWCSEDAHRPPDFPCVDKCIS